VEEIRELLERQLGSQHLIVTLFSRTQEFLKSQQQKPFIGRRDAMERLRKFVEGETKGVAIVYAPPGFGKTLFLCHWLKEFSSQPGTYFVYHFFNKDPILGGYATDLSSALAHLIGQVWAITRGDESFPSLSPDPNERRATLEGLLGDLKLPEGEKLVVVLDGLDEAESLLEHPPIPLSFPEGLFFVVSSRWDGEGELPKYLQGWARFTEFIPLHALNLDDLKEWLRKWGDGELAEFAEDEGFVRMLSEKTEGMPLYVRYLLDELVELKKQGGDVRAVLERKPKGLREYVREQVRELAPLVKNEAGVGKMLALLSVAKGAMREGEIEELTGLSVWDLDSLPVAVTRWFSVGKGEERTYAFAHPLLAEEFKVVLGKEAGAAERELVDWCMSWREHKSVYALRHLAGHLRERKDGRLYELARDEEFERVQREVLPPRTRFAPQNPPVIP